MMLRAVKLNSVSVSIILVIVAGTFLISSDVQAYLNQRRQIAEMEISIEQAKQAVEDMQASLTDQDIADISAYYAAHGQAAPAPEKLPEPSGKVAELLTKGACASCHGANYSKGIDGSYPKLAGQNADYLFVALKSYKMENQATWGRNNGIMAGIAKQFSNAELKELAKYLAAQPGELQVVPQSRFR